MAGYVAKRNAANAPREIELPSGYHVTIRRDLTIGEQDDLSARFDKGVPGTAAILAMITEWDLDDDEGNRLPLTLETLRELSNDDAMTIGEAIKARSEEPRGDAAFLDHSSRGSAEG